MSDYGEDSCGGVPSECGSDFFDNEERLTGTLKSLINSKSLQSTWTRFGKRLSALEASSRRFLQLTDEFKTDYVAQKVFDGCQMRHGKLLEQHSEALAKVQELTSRLEACVFEDHVPKLAKMESSVARLETTEEKIEKESLDMKRNVEAFQTHATRTITDMSEDLTKKVNSSLEEQPKLRRDLTDGLARLDREMKLLEGRAEKSMNDKIGKLPENFYTEEQSELQRSVVNCIDRVLCKPMRAETEDVDGKAAQIREDMTKFREDFSRHCKNVDRLFADQHLKFKKIQQETKDDLDTRATRKEVKKLEASVTTTTNVIRSEVEALQMKVVLKLNEFVDHFEKLHETLDDHEHALRHHAEEIENRGTKYDMLICQSQIEKCTLKDEFTRETTEMKKVIGWQSNKIEGFGLMTNLPAKKKGKARLGPKLARSASRLKRPSSALTEMSERSAPSPTETECGAPLPALGELESDGNDSLSGARSTMGTMGGLSDGNDPKSPRFPTESEAMASARPPRSPRSLPETDGLTNVRPLKLARSPADAASEATASLRGEDDSDTNIISIEEEGLKYERTSAGSGEPQADGNQNNNLAMSDEELHSDDHSFVESDEDVGEGSPSSALVRQQLEAIAMGVVALAFLVLRNPTHGSSRQMRLIQEQQLLQELQSLRHWITNRSAPHGWNPQRIATVALQCAHPRADEVHAPIPQVGLRELRPERSQDVEPASTRRLDTDTGDGAARAKKVRGGPPQGATAVRRAHSEKTPRRDVSQGLPPLRGVGVA